MTQKLIVEVNESNQIVSQQPYVENLNLEPNYPLWITLGVIFVLVLTLIIKSIVVTTQQTAKIVERFGKFRKIMHAGLGFKVPFIDVIRGDVSLKTEQLSFNVETKTKDDVFVNIKIAIQFFITSEKVYEAFYKFENPQQQIGAYVIDVVRSKVPSIELDEVFSKKDDIAIAVKEQLKATIEEYGYTIITALVIDINPDERVKNAMNQINESKRLRIAASEQGEAEKTLAVKKAEAEKSAQILEGEGIAGQRSAIVEGLKKSAEDLSQATGINKEEVMTLLMMTQYMDVMKTMGNQKVFFVDPSPTGMANLGNQIRNAMMVANDTK